MENINNGFWSGQGLNAVKDTKKAILRKKIILNIIIESYSKYDKIFRYIHMLFALTSPVIAFINQLATGSVEQTSTVTLVLSSIVAGMIKLKDYLKFDKTKDRAKQQTVKYSQLYERIDRELRKPNGKRQNEEDFIYWTSREFNNLEVGDPDLPHSLKDKYISLCKENNIPYEEDLAMLQELIKDAAIAVVVDHIADNEHGKVDDAQGNVDEAQGNTNIQNVHTKADSIVDRTVDRTHIDTINETPPKKVTTIRQRSESDEKARVEYREQIKTLDTSKDLQWAIDRLNTLES